MTFISSARRLMNVMAACAPRAALPPRVKSFGGFLRWRAFGWNVPSEPAVPPQPKVLQVISDTPLQLPVRSEPVPYAARYRCHKKPHNSSVEPVVLDSTDLPMFLVEDLADGSYWDIYVSAVNSSGTKGSLSKSAQGGVLTAAA